MIDLKGKSFLTLKDFTKEEIKYFIDLAKKLNLLEKQKRVDLFQYILYDNLDDSTS